MDEEKRQASFLYSLKAVLWSFTGLRRKSDFDADAARLNPVHIVIAAVVAVACLVALLITIVHFVVAK